jgi:hypothetical protein
MAVAASEWFGIGSEAIMKKADYEAAYGAIDMAPPLPQLTTAETIKAVSSSQRILDAFKAEFDAAMSQFRQPRGSGRGQYATRKRRAEARRQAWQAATAQLLPDKLPERWTAHVIGSWKDFCEEADFDQSLIKQATVDSDPLDLISDEQLEEMEGDQRDQLVESLAMATAVTAARFAKVTAGPTGPA